MVMLLYKDTCCKTKLYKCQLTHILADLGKIYTIYFTAIGFLKTKFKQMDSKRKKKTIDHYEYFVEFTKKFKKECDIIAENYSVDLVRPRFYDPNPRTFEKMKKILLKAPKPSSSKQIADDGLVIRQESGSSVSSAFSAKFGAAVAKARPGTRKPVSDDILNLEDGDDQLDNLIDEAHAETTRKQFVPIRGNAINSNPMGLKRKGNKAQMLTKDILRMYDTNVHTERSYFAMKI